MADNTEAATFRFDKASLVQLRLEAQDKQIKLNTLLNQIVRSHIEWHANATKAGFIPVRRKLMKKLFDFLTEEQIDAVAHDLSLDLTDGNLMMLVRERTQKAVLQFMENWLKASGFDYHHEMERGSHIYVIQHNMGAKWSYYLSKIFERTALKLTTSKPEIKTTEDALYIKLAIE